MWVISPQNQIFSSVIFSKIIGIQKKIKPTRDRFFESQKNPLMFSGIPGDFKKINPLAIAFANLKKLKVKKMFTLCFSRLLKTRLLHIPNIHKHKGRATKRKGGLSKGPYEQKNKNKTKPREPSWSRGCRRWQTWEACTPWRPSRNRRRKRRSPCPTCCGSARPW